MFHDVSPFLNHDSSEVTTIYPISIYQILVAGQQLVLGEKNYIMLTKDDHA